MPKLIIKNTMIYLIGTILSKLIPFILLPIVTGELSPESYGKYSLYLVFITFLIPFLSMSLDTNIVKNYYHFNNYKMAQLLKSIIYLVSIHIIVFILLLIVFFLILSEFFSIEFKYLFFLPLIIFSQTINSYYLSILRLEENAISSIKFEVSLSLITACLTLIFLFIFKLDWLSLIYSIAISTFSYSLFAIFKINKKFSIFAKNTIFYNIKIIYKVSIPLIFHLLSGSIIFMSDRLFIEHFISLSAVGMYTVALQFGMVTNILIEAIMRAYQPYFFKQLSTNNLKLPLYNQLMALTFIILSLITWIVSYTLFDLLIDHKYIDGKIVIIWISLGYAIRGIYMLYYNIMISEAKTNNIAKITFSAGILNLILNYILIQINGIVGIAQATIISFSYMALFIMFFSNKSHKYNWILIWRNQKNV